VQAAASTNARKYESGNPLQQALIRRFQARVLARLAGMEFGSVLDVGCGEGYLAEVISRRFPQAHITGVDLSASAVEAARGRVPAGRFEVASFEQLARWTERFDLVICSEVLEHLQDPASGLAVLGQRAAGHALLTVPWEPWFQLANLARGKYLDRLGNHPEHVQRWTHAAFVRLASTTFRKIDSETCFPWSIFVGRRAG
jgi:2-polyprenyl-3-methyl-5-hydroxy-6-metoxy-1,4-benzoquinol methylase